jgi:hypothetical protein
VPPSPPGREEAGSPHGLAGAAFGLTQGADKFILPGHVQPLHVSHESWRDVARTWFGFLRYLLNPWRADAGLVGPAPEEALYGRRSSAPLELLPGVGHEPEQFGHKLEIQTGVGCTRPVCPRRCQGSREPRGRTATPEEGRTEGASWRIAAVSIVSHSVGLRLTALRVTPRGHGVIVESSISPCSESGSRSIIPTRPNSPVA